MLLIDYIILGSVAISALIGLYRGFFPELFALATWVAAVWLAWRFAPGLVPYLGDRLASPEIALWVARAIVFVGVLIAGGLLTELVSLVIEKSGLSGTDRLLGLLFGLGRGLLVFAVFVVFAQSLGLAGTDWWRGSRLMPYGESAAAWLREVLPDALEAYLPEPEEPEQEQGEPAL